MCIRFANDGHSVYVGWRLRESEDLKSGVGLAVAAIVAAVGVCAGGVAAVDWDAVVVNICPASVVRFKLIINVFYRGSFADNCQISTACLYMSLDVIVP